MSNHVAGEPKAWSVTGRRGDRSSILNRPDPPTRAADDRTADVSMAALVKSLATPLLESFDHNSLVRTTTDEAAQLATDTLNWQCQSSWWSATMDLWIQAAQDHEILRLSLGTGRSSPWWGVALWEDRRAYDAHRTNSRTRIVRMADC